MAHHVNVILVLPVFFETNFSSSKVGGGGKPGLAGCGDTSGKKQVGTKEYIAMHQSGCGTLLEIADLGHVLLVPSKQIWQVIWLPLR